MKSTFKSCVLQLLIIMPLYINCNNNYKTEGEENSTKVDSLTNQENEASFCNPKKEPFVVIELFSYEGCKTCAEADKLFNSLVKSAELRNPKPNVIAIAGHVSYWKEEWIDRFGLKEVDSIQNLYCKILNVQQFTPQICFNGKNISVAEPNFMQNNLSFFLKQPASAGICIALDSNLSQQDRIIKVRYTTSSVPPGCVITFVVLESNLVSKPTEGDNAGKILVHDNVARKYKAIPCTKTSGEVLISLPNDLKKSNSSIVAFIRNLKNLEIIAGTNGVNLQEKK